MQLPWNIVSQKTIQLTWLSFQIEQLGKRGDIKNNFYTLSELEEFLDATKNYDFRYYTYFLLLASTGLRKSEALALHWSNIDFKNKTVRVKKRFLQDLITDNWYRVT